MNTEMIDRNNQEDEDMLLFGEYIDFISIPRKLRDRSNPLEDFSDSEFRMRFRLSKESVSVVLVGIIDLLRYESDRNQAISPINQFLIALRFYASASFQVCIIC